MKVRRKKVVSRVMLLFQKNYGFYEPYQILVDGTFCLAALRARVNLMYQIPLYLGQTKLLTTVCAVKETEDLVKHDLYGAMLILKQYAVHKCGHEKQPISARDCFVSMIGRRNDSHYIIASQDEELRRKLRKVAGTPILYMNHGTPVMEKPSRRSEVVSDKILRRSLLLTTTEKKVIKTLKKQFDVATPQTVAKRKRKVRGKNPLSCKKSKKNKNQFAANASAAENAANASAAENAANTTTKRKRNRVRVKIAKHVKEELSASSSKA